jgi:dihydrofolate reductase
MVRARKLPGREVLVVSSRAGKEVLRDNNTRNDDVRGNAPHDDAPDSAAPPGQPRFFPRLNAAIEWARPRYRRLYLAGGQSVYEAGLAFANTLLITRVLHSPEGDRFFPDVLDGGADWVNVHDEPRPGAEKPEYCFTVYRRGAEAASPSCPPLPEDLLL